MERKTDKLSAINSLIDNPSQTINAVVTDVRRYPDGRSQISYSNESGNFGFVGKVNPEPTVGSNIEINVVDHTTIVSVVYQSED